MSGLLYLVFVLGLAFEFMNGFHDAANAIATVVATRVMRPFVAVLMAGALNLLGALSGTAVAVTLGKGIVDPTVVTETTVAIALFSAVLWDILTWYFGLPTSSSHALIFSLIGAAVAGHGFGVVVFSGTFKTMLGLVYSPLIGLAFGGLVIVILFWIFHRSLPSRVHAIFSRLQILSSAYMAFSHGGNDGQKTMGVLSLALFTAGLLGPTFYVPIWVMFACAVAMGLGTALGGWRIIRTMGHRLVKLTPIDGFAAEIAGGTAIEIATRLGIPISTTHAITGSILGVGSVRGPRKVGWHVAGSIVMAWIMTIPGCFLFGYLIDRVLASLSLIGFVVPGV
ncbi:MAG TPA: inorganic phosphate transporter [Chloroflexota bacterium]|nr:inorganic phosphate transporter [Chloroflexota bacterium]